VVVEDDEAIVYSIQAFLFPAISKNHSVQRKMSFSVPDLNHKSMWSIALAIDVELSKDSCRVGSFASPSNPELHGLFGGCIQHEFFMDFVVSGASLDTPHIGAVSQLRQSEAPNVNPVLGSHLPFIVLVSAQVVYCFVVELE